MKEHRFSRWVKLTIFATLLVVVALGIVTYRNTSLLLATDRLVAETYRAREVAESVLSSLASAETSQRGFLLTNDENFLDQFDVSVERSKQKLTALCTLAMDDELFQQKLHKLEELAAKRLKQLEQGIALRKATPEDQSISQAREQVLRSGGREMMEEVRSDFADINKYQTDLVNVRERESARRAAVTKYSIIVGHLLAIALLSLAVVEVISDRRRRSDAESKLETSEERLSAIVDSALDGIIVVDRDQRITFLNRAAEEIFDNEESVVGQPLEKFLPHADCGGKQEDIFESLQSEIRTKRFDNVRARHVDGKEFPIECSLAKFQANGQPLTTIMVRDVTERESHKAKLREQSAVLDQVRDAIHMCDLEGRVLYWNQGAEQLYGWSPQDALGRLVTELRIPVDVEGSEQAIRLTLERGDWSGELLHRTRHGREVLVEERRTLIRDDEETPRAQLVFEIDVTDRKKTEELHRRSQRLESIGTLAGGIAHDLNNVLTPIMLGATLLRREQPLKQQQQVATNVLSAAERGAEMIKQLLSFAGGKDVVRTSMKLSDVIHEVQGILEHSLPKSVELHIDLMDKLWPVIGDPTELCQLMLNLGINARDAMPDGGHLTISAENVDVDEQRAKTHPGLSIGPYVMLSFSDTGVGIPPELVDKVFDPFFTTKQQGKGTGLGLATCSGIVRGLGGAINVYSELGCGTEFIIYLPAAQSGGLVKASPNAGLLAQGNGELILLVDDEVMVLDVARATLEANGYRVLSASSGTEAVSVFSDKADTIQAAIVDMMMPGMDGRETMQALKELKPALRVIASSGLRKRGRNHQTLTGEAAFLAKPYSDRQLLSTLRLVLHGDVASAVADQSSPMES